MTRTRFVFFLSFVLCVYVSVLSFVPATHAQTADDLQTQIDTTQQKRDALNADIAAIQKQLDAIGTQKNTLQSTISTLTLTQKQLASQIQLTQNQIASANLQIRQLTNSIGDKEAAIIADQDAISKALRVVAEGEGTPLITNLIKSDSLSDAWRLADQMSQFNQALSSNINNLRTVKTQLASNRDAVTKAKADLLALQNQLTIQKRSVDASKTAQTQLLSETKNQESTYQKLIAQKQAAEKSFEQDLINLQGQLNLVVHPNLLPKVGSGVLGWPFSNAFMFNCTQRRNVFGNLFCITQYFGNTAFSTANAQIYNGHGHNAIDIAAPIGTPVYAALGGTVLATGNTDLVRGCYSFGKWIMVTHGNGLSTLYAHLSEIDVTKGQWVDTKQLLGLSGMTGYATGPHIHFGVYATEGTEIMTLKQFRGATVGCANATMPVATLSAYLNPLSYL
jgi:murein DD-endopeptidase MepM/ murein hydrolase activator NlpD